MISVSSFARQSCKIYGSENNNVVALERSMVSAHSGGEIDIYVHLSKPSQGETRVFVEVRDAEEKLIGTAVVTVPEGEKDNYSGDGTGHYTDHRYENYNLKDGTYYFLSIAEASCIY